MSFSLFGHFMSLQTPVRWLNYICEKQLRFSFFLSLFGVLTICQFQPTLSTNLLSMLALLSLLLYTAPELKTELQQKTSPKMPLSKHGKPATPLMRKARFQAGYAQLPETLPSTTCENTAEWSCLEITQSPKREIQAPFPTHSPKCLKLSMKRPSKTRFKLHYRSFPLNMPRLSACITSKT